MSEEMRGNPEAIFFTGTFTDQRIKQLCEKYNIDPENVNEIATKEVRLFMERLRQTNREKKSIKHWIVTEKGHTNTRRIHIHGIFWAKNKAGLSYLLNKLWTAGYSYQGKYVNDRTVNYIVKYMTKTDLDNPTYKGIVLASPGIGKNYINRWDAKRNTYKTWKSEYDKTDETYRFRNGEKAVLPKYYKEKLYTEDQREILWIEKINEGYQFIMGEKFKVTNEKEEKEFLKVQDFYRRQCVSSHKDNPKLWEEKKQERKRIKTKGYRQRERTDRGKWYKKWDKTMEKLDKDLKEFQKLYETEQLIR